MPGHTHPPLLSVHVSFPHPVFSPSSPWPCQPGPLVHSPTWKGCRYSSSRCRGMRALSQCSMATVSLGSGMGSSSATSAGPAGAAAPPPPASPAAPAAAAAEAGPPAGPSPAPGAAPPAAAGSSAAWPPVAAAAGAALWVLAAEAAAHGATAGGTPACSGERSRTAACHHLTCCTDCASRCCAGDIPDSLLANAVGLGCGCDRSGCTSPCCWTTPLLCHEAAALATQASTKACTVALTAPRASSSLSS